MTFILNIPGALTFYCANRETEVGGAVDQYYLTHQGQCQIFNGWLSIKLCSKGSKATSSQIPEVISSVPMVLNLPKALTL